MLALLLGGVFGCDLVASTAALASMPSVQSHVDGPGSEAAARVGSEPAIPVAPPVAACAVARRAAPVRGQEAGAPLEVNPALRVVVVTPSRLGPEVASAALPLPLSERRALLQVFLI